MPSLNLDGKVKTSTVYGSLISITMVCVLAIYADYKLAILIRRENANVSDFIEEMALTGEDRLNF